MTTTLKCLFDLFWGGGQALFIPVLPGHLMKYRCKTHWLTMEQLVDSSKWIDEKSLLSLVVFDGFFERAADRFQDLNTREFLVVAGHHCPGS